MVCSTPAGSARRDPLPLNGCELHVQPDVVVNGGAHLALDSATADFT